MHISAREMSRSQENPRQGPTLSVANLEDPLDPRLPLRGSPVSCHSLREGPLPVAMPEEP